MWPFVGLIAGLIGGVAVGLKPFLERRRKNKSVGHMTTFPSLKYARMLASGEMTVEEYAKLTEQDLEPVVEEIGNEADEE